MLDKMRPRRSGYGIFTFLIDSLRRLNLFGFEVSPTDSLEGKQEAVAKQRSNQPGRQQDGAVVRGRSPDTRVPKHLQPRLRSLR